MAGPHGVSLARSTPTTAQALGERPTVAPPGASVRLSTLQRNAIAQFLNRRDFSAKDIAGYDYQVIANLPKIGKKGIVAIRSWLHAHGLDLKNIPAEQSETHQRRHQEKLDHAVRLLEKNGYRVLAPE
jgi:hypothetical protein